MSCYCYGSSKSYLSMGRGGRAFYGLRVKYFGWLMMRVHGKDLFFISSNAWLVGVGFCGLNFLKFCGDGCFLL